MNFDSDNTSGAHPAVIEAMLAANAGHAPAYGADDLTAAAEARIRTVLDAPRAEVFLVPGGTAANALALAAVSQPWGNIFCADSAHVLTSECGAIPFYTGGATLVPVAAEGGLIDAGALAAALQTHGRKDVHVGERAALTLTNATEWGRLYSPDAVAALTAQAAAAGIPAHMDGARFANAVAALGCSPAELSHRAGIDILSLGGTKNGGMMVEAVVVFDPSREGGMGMRRMRAGHLMSKHRFLAAQMLALLRDDLWLTLARHANAMAARLGQGLVAAGVPLLQPVESNQAFATLTAAQDAALQAAGARYYPWPHVQTDPSAVSVRLVCSWATTEAEVDHVLTVLRGV